MEGISRQLKKGVLEILLLKLLAQEEMYGYELMQRLNAYANGYFAIKEGTLYPILYRLEDGGMITSSWAEANGRRGVPRKYYALTGEGRQYLSYATDELAQFMQATISIIGGNQDAK